MNDLKRAARTTATRSFFGTIGRVGFAALLIALVGCGGGGSGGSTGAPVPPPANTSFEGFVRDALKDDPSAQPREINDVPFTIQVQEATFDDAFPA
jgi:hypothetical protein